ncbi:MAG: hypothetical protein Q3M24_12460 [Candidatus Electrothrix aestuarii]|uniref:Uncharacterized protein n=1 Tax=Candidatus Electrothrix aestuarii TaxID=3062594 RepID=A0AAU8LNT2_9BACT|nr:hypothetical protein [Candidatus Electrothrix aestuarii]
MKTSIPGILCMLLSCLLASCAQSPLTNNTGQITTISGNLNIYPNLERNLLHPNDKVIFEFTSTGAAIDINAIQINPGVPGAPVLSCGHNASCFGNTIRAEYTYKNRGYYNMSIQYGGEVLAGKRILILENYRSDEELRYEAIKEIAAELKPVLQKIARGKIAFSALKDANFEYAEDQKDVEIIYGLMQALVESSTRSSGYEILERAPHALVRLAHEAVYTLPKNSTRPQKQKQLEYGISTFNKGLKQPLVYGIKPSGLDDTFFSVGMKGNVNSSGNQHNKAQSNRSGFSSSQARGSSYQKTYQERPVMFARFDTADFLIVIERLEDDDRPADELVQRSKQDYYDTAYNTKAIKRTAKIKINVRILDTNGKILWIKDITNQASDLVIPQYAPPVQTWTERKSKIRAPAQYPSAFNPITGLINAVTIDPITGLLKTVGQTVEQVTDSLSE